jgi:hypothetical protein
MLMRIVGNLGAPICFPSGAPICFPSGALI